jgi:hypothetical protein
MGQLPSASSSTAPFLVSAGFFAFLFWQYLDRAYTSCLWQMRLTCQDHSFANIKYVVNLTQYTHMRSPHMRTPLSTRGYIRFANNSIPPNFKWVHWLYKVLKMQEEDCTFALLPNRMKALKASFVLECTYTCHIEISFVKHEEHVAHYIQTYFRYS